MKKNYLKSKKIGKKGMATFTLVLLLLLLLLLFLFLVVVVVVVVVGVGFSNAYRAMDEFMNKKPLNIRKRLMMRNWNLTSETIHGVGNLTTAWEGWGIWPCCLDFMLLARVCRTWVISASWLNQTGPNPTFWRTLEDKVPHSWPVGCKEMDW